MRDNIISNIPVIFRFEVVYMAGKPMLLDREHIISLYQSFISIQDIATQFGVNHKTIRKVLHGAGIETPIHRHTKKPNLEEVLTLYNQGIGVAGIAKRLGYGRTYMVCFFDKHGIRQRNRKEQQFERMKNSTQEQIAHLTQKAHKTAKGRKRSFEELRNRAVSRYKNQSFADSKYEAFFSDYLSKMKIEFDRQFPCGPYNLDFIIGYVAVEIFGGNWHYSGLHFARFAERTKYVLNSGFFLICIFVSESKGDNFESIINDKFIPVFNSFRGDKSGITKYRVIWGTSEYITGGSCNDNDFPLIKPTENIRNSVTGRYVSIPK
jgi:very-short-patch-repair endonuclease/transposase-like protein